MVVTAVARTARSNLTGPEIAQKIPFRRDMFASVRVARAFFLLMQHDLLTLENIALHSLRTAPRSNTPVLPGWWT